MDTNNLRYFAAVAKYGSITQAAKAAYISQPQLSHIIRQLEKEMGLTLFRRTSHGTKLTVDGQRILLHCQVILKEMDRLQNMVNAHRIEKLPQCKHDPIFPYSRVLQRDLPTLSGH